MPILEQILSSIDFQTYVTPMLLYIIAIVIYAVIIWNYYKYLGKRDLFRLDWSKIDGAKHKKARKFYVVVAHAVKYVIVFPVITFVWFSILSVLLIFMSKSQPLGNVLLISMTLVVSARVLAYYSEELAKELAKLLPLAMLALFIVDPTYFSLESSLLKLSQVPDYWITLLNYLLFAVLLEIILRLVVDIKDSVKSYRFQKSEASGG